jgi:hypothetical protein
VRGSHQIKFGIDLMMPMHNEYFDVAPTRGNLRFQATFTGNAFADFLIGYPNRAELTNVFVVNQELWSSSFYAQDDWKPTDQADPQPRAALRLHAAGDREGQPVWPTSIQRDRVSWCSRRTARWPIGRW